MSNKGESSRQSLDAPFKPASWLAKIDFINHLVLFNNVLMAVLAEQGGGKSTFIQLLTANLDPGIKFHTMTAAAPFSADDFLAQMVEAFHLRDDAQPTLASLVEQINERKAHVLMIIDDAQHVPDEFLKEVLEIVKAQEGAAFFHLCIVCDYSLIGSLNRLDKDDYKNLIHTITPGSLSESETKTYLLSYLPSPKRLEKTMSSDRLKQFYQLTGGEIARINLEMHNFFSADALKEPPKPKSLAKRLTLTASLVIVGLAGHYIWQNQDELRRTLSFSLSEKNLASTQPASLQEQPAVSRLLPIDKPLVSEIPPFNVAVTTQALQPPPLKRMIEISNSDEETNDNLVVMDKVLVIPKSLARNTETTPRQPSRTVHHQQPAKPIMAVPELAKVTPPLSRVQEQARAVATAAKTSGQFTIQLLAGRSPEELKRFVHAHGIHDAVKVRKVSRNGRVWYVLTMGEYGQIEQARAAMNHLPPAVIPFKPWIRSVSGLPVVG
ncbi:AAA family ATPase [Legionella erythra]|uniref:DamX-related protein n=1 Tax=Legionella erythra TaxID=448 RepID=A0A0W0TJI1_LEGER|nr:AAA family ATPase [Legionella erythra]KTC95775.1 DamX-related protein [Legionella erythra]